MLVSIPERVLEALKRVSGEPWSSCGAVSIPERVLEALKPLCTSSGKGSPSLFQSLKGF